MTTRTVEREIQRAFSNDPFGDPRITSREAGKIIGAAEDQPNPRGKQVTDGEAKRIGDVFERSVHPKIRDLVTLAMPEDPMRASIDRGAVRAFESFFATHDLPYGANIRQKIEAAIDQNGYGKELAGAPAGVEKMTYLFLKDQRPVDGNMTEAFVDAKKKVFYLKSTGAGMGGPDTVGPYWYGPNPLPGKGSKGRESTVNKLRAALTKGLKAQNLEWKAPPDVLPLGGKFIRVPLMREKHPDGFAYAALVPVGAGLDPNKPKRFFVERSGGFAGLTQVAEISLEKPKPAPAIEVVGIRNRMPIVGQTPDYVILDKSGWKSPPKSLTVIQDGQATTVPINNETHDLVARGLRFDDGASALKGTVTLANGDEVAVSIRLQTAY